MVADNDVQNYATNEKNITIIINRSIISINNLAREIINIIVQSTMQAPSGRDLMSVIAQYVRVFS